MPAMPLTFRLKTFPFRVIIRCLWHLDRATTERWAWAWISERYDDLTGDALQRSEDAFRSLPAYFTRASIRLADETLAEMRRWALHPTDLTPELHGRLDARLRERLVLRNVWRPTSATDDREGRAPTA